MPSYSLRAASRASNVYSVPSTPRTPCVLGELRPTTLQPNMMPFSRSTRAPETGAKPEARSSLRKVCIGRRRLVAVVIRSLEKKKGPAFLLAPKNAACVFWHSHQVANLAMPFCCQHDPAPLQLDSLQL